MHFPTPATVVLLSLPLTLAQIYKPPTYSSSSNPYGFVGLGDTPTASPTASPSPSSSPIKVTVGANGLTYTPNSITASIGSTIEFSFFPKNHTVTQSSFSNPCHPLEGGFSSSFVPTKEAPSGTGSTFTITVNDTKPIWVYCGQTVGNHCQQGMVMAINAPPTGNTLSAFIARAKNATTSTVFAGGAVGGVLSLAGSNSPSSSSSSIKSIHSAVSTAAVLSTYTSNSHTYTTTVGSTTIQTTLAGTAAGAGAASSSSSSTGTQSNGADGGRNIVRGSGIVAVIVAVVGCVVGL